MKNPDKITVTFTQEDVNTAKSYIDCDNCLLATALKRMGFTAQVRCVGVTYIGPDTYYPKEAFHAGIVELPVSQKYNPEVVGMTINLIKQAK